MTDDKIKLKRGHRRDDGMIFWSYSNGCETWISEVELIERKEKARMAMIEWRKLNPLKAREWTKKWRDSNPQRAKESAAKWARENPDKVRAKRNLWASRNREKCRELNREKYRKQKLINPDALRKKSRASASKWRANNPDLARQRMRKWQIENADKVTAYAQKRHAAKKASVPADCRECIIDGFYAIADRVSKCIGIKHEVDHIQPISKGGSHCHRNLQVIPASLNRRKSARLDFILPGCYRSDGWTVEKSPQHR